MLLTIWTVLHTLPLPLSPLLPLETPPYSPFLPGALRARGAARWAPSPAPVVVEDEARRGRGSERMEGRGGGKIRKGERTKCTDFGMAFNT